MRARFVGILTVLLVTLGMLTGAGAALADDDYPPDIEEPSVDPEEPEVGGELDEDPDVPPDEGDATGTPDERPVEPADVDDEAVVLGVSLPRTGTSVALLALLGSGLLGFGVLLVLRRRSPGDPA